MAVGINQTGCNLCGSFVPTTQGLCASCNAQPMWTTTSGPNYTTTTDTTTVSPGWGGVISMDTNAFGMDGAFPTHDKHDDRHFKVADEYAKQQAMMRKYLDYRAEHKEEFKCYG